MPNRIAEQLAGNQRDLFANRLWEHSKIIAKNRSKVADTGRGGRDTQRTHPITFPRDARAQTTALAASTGIDDPPRTFPGQIVPNLVGDSQRHFEASSAAIARQGRDRAALRVEQASHDVEAEPDPAESPTITTDLVEALEDLGVFAAGYPKAAVTNGSNHVITLAARRNRDRTAVGGVLDRVLEKLTENDLHRTRVADNLRQIRCDFEDQFVIGCHCRKSGYRRAKQATKIKAHVRVSGRRETGSRPEQQLLDERGQ